jgi:ApaG protein
MSADFQATTAGITVTVKVYYLDDQSKPESGQFIWAYRINITNRGALTVQLLRRTWRITDARGQTQTIQGEGVIGETPVLEPGESFEYTSGTPLSTPSGFMAGQFHMLAMLTGALFDIEIPTFSLDSPHQNHRLH